MVSFSSLKLDKQFELIFFSLDNFFFLFLDHLDSIQQLLLFWLHYFSCLNWLAYVLFWCWSCQEFRFGWVHWKCVQGGFTSNDYAEWEELNHAFLKSGRASFNLSLMEYRKLLMSFHKLSYLMKSFELE